MNERRSMDDDELTCQELVEIVTEYLEGALALGERSRFERHLVYCPGCVYYLEQMRKTIELVGELTEDSIPPEVEEGFLQVFQIGRAHV